MNTLNRFAGGIMDVVLKPFELLGTAAALILVSAIFGIIALLIFKQVSWQAGIKRTKDRIKGDMIAIRLYQDDLAVVASSVLKILLRNFQYLFLNFGPILPLLAPFALVLSQMVVRYGFDPLPVQDSETVANALAGEGTTITIHLKDSQRDAAKALTVSYPEGIQTVSPLIRNSFDGVAFQEVVATAPVNGLIELKVDGKLVGTKEIVAGSKRPKKMQGERVSSFWSSWLWPAEDTFDSESPIGSIVFEYPEHSLGWLPGGPGGILLVFFVASILGGLVILKPLNIQI